MLSKFQAPDLGLGRARANSLGSDLRPGCQQSPAQHPKIRSDHHTGKQFLQAISSLTAGREHLLPSLPAEHHTGTSKKGGASRQPPILTPALRSRQAAKVCLHKGKHAGFAIPKATLLGRGKGVMAAGLSHTTTTTDPSLPSRHIQLLCRLPQSLHITLPSQAACGVPSRSSCASPAPGAASTR